VILYSQKNFTIEEQYSAVTSQ